MQSSQTDHPAEKAPRVSIGLPVYNGQRFIRAAIQSLLGQTFRDFELIICDNASTDETPRICQEYARVDPRVRYYRHPANIGAGPNFNRTFELSRGEYFKWSSDDDVCGPDVLERCIEVLDCNSEVVLAYPKVTIIDENGKTINSAFRGLRLDAPEPAGRFAEMLSENAKGCFGIFGLIRSSALKQTHLLRPWAAADRNLLARLSLLGRFQEVPQTDLFIRSHPGRSVREYPTAAAQSVWFDPRNAGRRIFPRWKVLRDYMGAIRETPIDARSRAACYRVLAKRVSVKELVRDVLVVLAEMGRPKRSQLRKVSPHRSGGTSVAQMKS